MEGVEHPNTRQVLAEGDSYRDVEADHSVRDVVPRAWRLVHSLNFCISKVIGKYAAYPAVDPDVFQRVHDALARGTSEIQTTAELGNYCQELRGVANCPAVELLHPPGADDTDARISAVAHVVRRHTRIDDSLFRELITGLLSWSPADKKLILTTLQSIIRS